MKIVIQGLLFGLLLVSCSKSEDNDPNALDSNLLSAVAVYNGVEGISNIEVFLDNSPLNTAMKKIPLGEMLSHINVLPGERMLSSLLQKEQEKGQQMSMPPDVSRAQQNRMLFEAGKVYSLFVYGNSKDDLQHKLVEDDLLKARQGRFKIRVANFRMDATKNLSFTFTARSPAIVSNYEAKFTEVTGFADYPVGDYTLTIEGMGKDLESYNMAYKFEDQGVYTLWVWGSAKTAAEKDADGNVVKYPITLTRHGLTQTMY